MFSTMEWDLSCIIAVLIYMIHSTKIGVRPAQYHKMTLSLELNTLTPGYIYENESKVLMVWQDY